MKLAIKKLIAVICILLILLSNMSLYTEALAADRQENMQPSISNNQESDERKVEEVGKVEEMTTMNWEKDMNPSIGSITFANNGKEVNMTGNKTLPGKNAVYIIPTNHQEQTLQFDYSVEFGDSFIAAGVLLNVKKENGTLKGYMLSFNNNDPQYGQEKAKVWFNEAGGKLGALWKFTYTLGNNNDNTIPRTLVKAIDLPQSGSMVVKSSGNQISITGTGINEIININPNEAGDGFGYFTDHYDHNCDRIGSFSLRNCVFTTVDLLPHNLYVDPNGGTWENSSAVSRVTGIYKDTRNIPLPVRQGYTFVGWKKIGNSGTMSTLTGNAVYTFGEDETTDDRIIAQWIKIDATKQSNVTTGKVVQNQEVTYTIVVTNSGTVDGRAVVKDSAPTGTTFVPKSITINGTGTAHTEQDLKNGITINIPAPVSGQTTRSATLSFKVKVNKLTNNAQIKNTAQYKDTTVNPNPPEKNTNEVVLRYVEPIISQSKSQLTQNKAEYVIKGERVTYTIFIANDGEQGKDVIVRDTVPTGTTFVQGSVKINGVQNSSITEANLKNGITVNVPATTKNVSVSFDVTINDLNDEDIITNIATVDEKQTNEVKLRYVEPIISQKKDVETENKLDYVVNGEKIKYTITVMNNGGLSKDVIIKDVIPEGTTFVPNSVKINNQTAQKGNGQPITKEDIQNGVQVTVPAKIVKARKNMITPNILEKYVSKINIEEVGDTLYDAGVVTLSFEVTVNDIDDETIITNVATVDNNQTNQVISKYAEPIISYKKEAETEYDMDYVVGDEIITYNIIVENDGTLEKKVVVKDEIPEGTTFVKDSIEVDGKPYKNKMNKPADEDDLEEGIEVTVPAKTTKKSEESKSKSQADNKSNKKDEDDEEEDNQKDYIPGKVVISFKVKVDKLEKDTDTAEITNIAIVDGEETNKVEHEVLPFNMKIEKTIKEFTINGINQNVGNGKIMKTEIAAKDFSQVIAIIKYKITVTNTGKVKGDATVEDAIPDGFILSDWNPSYWKNTKENKIQTTVEGLEPGDSKDLEVVLVWQSAENNVGSKVNKVEIIGTSNESNAEETDDDDNKSEATVVISVKTGKEASKYIGVGILSLAILFVGLIIIKKTVLN